MSDTNIGIKVQFEYDGSGKAVVGDVERIKSALNGVLSGYNDMKNTATKATGEAAQSTKKLSEEEKSTEESTKGLGSSLQSLKSAASGIDYPFKNFIKSLTRIAKLRFLRGIIRSITGAFKEGLSNIYQYSAALNNTDASHMKSSLDSAATSLLYMKNAVGAAVAPLIAQLIPTLQQVVGWLVSAADSLAQFFAVLNGQSTYTRAKKSAVTWGDVATATETAATAAKEYKNTILSFDEINALDDVSDSGSGGGGGGGSSAPNYGDMFEEAPIKKSWLTDLAKTLKENWSDVLSIVKAIGIALLTWKIADAVTSFFNKLGLTKAAGAIKIAAGLIIGITGVTLAFEAGYKAGFTGKADLTTIIKGLIGIALGGVGGALVAQGLTALGVAGLSTGVGALVGIAITAFAVFVGWKLGENARFIKEAKETIEDYEGQVDEILNRQNTYLPVSEEAWKEYDATLSKLGYAKILTREITELAGKEALSNTEKHRAKILIKQLNGLGLDGIKAEWDETTKKIKINSNAIYKNIEAMKEAAYQKALIKQLSAAYDDLAQAQIDNETAQRHYQKAWEELRKEWGYNDEALNKIMGDELTAQHILGDTSKAIHWANEELKASKKRFDEASDSVTDAEAAWSSYKDSADDATKATGENTKEIKTNKNAVKDAKDMVGDMIEANKTYNNTKIDSTQKRKALGEVESAAKNTKNSIDDTTKATKQYGGYKLNTSQHKGQIDNVKGAAKDASGNINTLKDRMDDVNRQKISTKENVEQIGNVKTESYYATGNIDNVKSSLGELDKTEIKGEGIHSFFTDLSKWVLESDSFVAGLIRSLSGLDGLQQKIDDAKSTTKKKGKKDGGYVTRSIGGYIPRFDGGGINTADIFLANENGMPPELVGHIGNRTAVANQGQMVDAMAQGVYKAMSELMGQGSPTEVNVYMDGQRVASVVDRANRQKNRRMNVRVN